MLTGGISAAGTGVATVRPTQLIMTVFWTINSLKNVETNNFEIKSWIYEYNM